MAGYSLGGAKASWMAALDGRLRAALVCGSAAPRPIVRFRFDTFAPCGDSQKLPPWEQITSARESFDSGRDFTVDWVHLKLNDQAQRTVLCKDPFRSVDERVKRLIASM